MVMADLTGYLGLFGAAFLSATLLPGGSELVFVGLLVPDPAKLPLLLALATLGNTLGSGVNWFCGRFLIRLSDRRWFPVSETQVTRAERVFGRWGWPSLLFAWLPVVGDALTVIAGALRVPLPVFLLLVGLGKLLRYAFVAWATLAWIG
jgi:membrane protein YqaA with SNARE-associated domain